MVTDVDLHRITIAEYERMGAAGVFDDLHVLEPGGARCDVKVELLDGLLLEMSPQGERHVAIVHAVAALFLARFELVRVQSSLALGEHWMPEPDVALVDGERRLLTVEVAITTQRRDAEKADAYARAGVERYWLIDAPAGVVSEHSDPTRSGYGLVRRLRGTDVLDAHVAATRATTVAELLG